MKSSLSVGDKLLLAAYELETASRPPFSAEDLVIAAWKAFPDAFSLAGHTQYPDSNRVLVEIMGTKPLRRYGLVAKVGMKMYQLTEAGRRRARALLDAEVRPAGTRVSLDRKLASKLRGLLASKAVQKVRNGRSEELTFHDACVFWGISPRSSAKEFYARIADLEAVVDAAKGSIQEGDVSFEHGGQPFGEADIDALAEIHRRLLARFEGEIAIIRKRTDERV